MQGYAFAYNGVTINALADIQARKFIAIQRADGFTAPELRHSQSTIAGNHGIVDALSYVGGRIITLEGVLFGPTENDVLDLEEDLNASFIIPDVPTVANDGYHQLIFSKAGEVTKFVNAKIHSLPKISRLLHARCSKQFQVQFRCQDPRIYAVSEQSAAFVRSVTTGGFPAPFPMVFPGGTYLNQIQLTNNGNWSAPVSYRITNTDVIDVEVPRVTNVTNDIYQEFNMTLAPGDYIDVDTLEGTAVDQNGDNVLQFETANSQWLYVSPGSQLWRLTTDAGEATMTLTFRNTWISTPR